MMRKRSAMMFICIFMIIGTGIVIADAPNPWTKTGDVLHTSATNRVAIGTDDPMMPRAYSKPENKFRGLHIADTDSAVPVGLILQGAQFAQTVSSEIRFGDEQYNILYSMGVPSHRSENLRNYYLNYHYAGQGGAGFKRVMTIDPNIPYPHSSDYAIKLHDDALIIYNEGRVGIGKIPSMMLDVEGNIAATQLCIGEDCRSSWPPVDSSSGSCTGVTTGQISDGAITTHDYAPSAVGLSEIKTNEVQRTVTGQCPTGQFMWKINEDGTVHCRTDITNPKGSGENVECRGCKDQFVDVGKQDSIKSDMIKADAVTSSGMAFNSVGSEEIVKTEVQARVNDGCGSDEAIQAIGDNGGITCVKVTGTEENCEKDGACNNVYATDSVQAKTISFNGELMPGGVKCDKDQTIVKKEGKWVCADAPDLLSDNSLHHGNGMSALHVTSLGNVFVGFRWEDGYSDKLTVDGNMKVTGDLYAIKAAAKQLTVENKICLEADTDEDPIKGEDCKSGWPGLVGFDSGVATDGALVSVPDGYAITDCHIQVSPARLTFNKVYSTDSSAKKMYTDIKATEYGNKWIINCESFDYLGRNEIFTGSCNYLVICTKGQTK